MKLKKLFAGIVAVAMMATMAAPAFASTGAVTSKVKQNIGNPGKVNITKVIDGTGYGTESVEFAIDNESKPILVTHNTTLTQEQKDALKIFIENTDNKVSISDSSAGNTGRATGTLTIQLPEYTSVGTYVYKFHEVAGSTAGMTYDTASKWLLVNVYNDVNADGELVDGSALKVNAVVLNSDPKSALENTTTKGDLSSLAGNKIDQINNKYEAGTYTVKKLVKGNMSDRAKKFNFRVTFEKAKGATIPGIKVGETALNLEWKASTTNPEVEVATYDDFQLSHNEDKTFSNIPYGVKVSVVELTDSKGELTTTGSKLMNGEYEVTYKDNRNAATEINKENANVTATIINDSQVNVNTGVILDNAPYIALLTIVAAGAVVMIMKKRRNYED